MKNSIDVYDRMGDKVEKAVKKSGQDAVSVVYSAYECDENDEPIDNLDEVAVVGRVIFVADKDTHWGGDNSEEYRSEILLNPTWLQVCICANAMMRKTKDTHHVFMDGVDLVTKDKADSKLMKRLGVKMYEFAMGS